VSATEAFARVKIGALLRDAGWNLTDGASVLFEPTLPDGTKTDYVLCDRQGRPMEALEAKRASIDPIAAQDQGRHYAEQLGVPFVLVVPRFDFSLLWNGRAYAPGYSGPEPGRPRGNRLATADPVELVLSRTWRPAPRRTRPIAQA